MYIFLYEAAQVATLLSLSVSTAASGFQRYSTFTASGLQFTFVPSALIKRNNIHRWSALDMRRGPLICANSVRFWSKRSCYDMVRKFRTVVPSQLFRLISARYLLTYAVDHHEIYTNKTGCHYGWSGRVSETLRVPQIQSDTQHDSGEQHRVP
ncbi:hypothetical protein F5I97DRAFT_965233 [Phlebopus sp. FC_14]|nr:hypothetical protein F5I97DRAFT_965233 [Phlebopus sp. FC_14]